MAEERKILKINGFSLDITVPEKRNGGGRKKGYKQTEEQRINLSNSRSKLNSKVQTIIVEALKNGLSMTRLASLAGLDPTTIVRWLKEGEKNVTEKYADFYRACKKAEVECEESCILVVRKAINGDLKSTKVKKVYSTDKEGNRIVISDEKVVTRNSPSWTAAMTFLERKYPERWGRYDRLSVGGDPDNPIIPKEDLMKFLVSYIGEPKLVIDIPKKEETERIVE